MGLVASLAVGPMLMDIARDEEIRALEQKRLNKLRSLPGHGFVLGDVDLNFIKKVQTNKPEVRFAHSHNDGRQCYCGCERECRMGEFHSDVERIYLTGIYKPKYKALFNGHPKSAMENNFFLVNKRKCANNTASREYPKVRLKPMSHNFPPHLPPPSSINKEDMYDSKRQVSFKA